MIAKIRTAGATDVIQVGASWAEADAYLKEEFLAKDENGVHVPPFDHPDVWDGASTIIDELEEKPDAVVCSVGGGGLFCGLMIGLDRMGWGDVKVLALETVGAESLAKSLEKGELTSLPEITSLATCLGAKTVARKAFEYGGRENVKTVVLEDREAVMGCWRLADDERLLVEPGCGVSVALCYNGKLKELLPGLTVETKVVVIVCGGAAVTVEMLWEWRQKFGEVEKQSTDDRGVPSTLIAPEGGCGMKRYNQPETKNQ